MFIKRSLVLIAACLLAPAEARAQEDAYARFELLAPETGTFRMTLDLAAVSAGRTSFSASTAKVSTVADVSAIDLSTGDALKVEQKPGFILVSFNRPVPAGAETRIRLQATFTGKGYYKTGDTIVFTRTDLPERCSVVLPRGYEIVSANMPVQVLEESDGRIVASLMQPPWGAYNVAPADPTLVIKARQLAARSAPPASAAAAPPAPPIADAPPREQPMNQIRVTERAVQDREIVYFLKEPDTHAFALYHDYTAMREGERQYVNVVRTGSTVSDPSAKNLDTGEELKTRTLTGADIAREKIEIPDRVDPETQVVLIPFPPVKKGTSLRLRITETYTDPARYALVDGQLMWRRSFGRPRNDMVLPAGWYLTTSSIPAVLTQESDGRIRLSLWNPRPDTIDVLVRARRR